MANAFNIKINKIKKWLIKEDPDMENLVVPLAMW